MRPIRPLINFSGLFLCFKINLVRISEPYIFDLPNNIYMITELLKSEGLPDPAFPFTIKNFDNGQTTYYGMSRRCYIAAQIMASIAPKYDNAQDAAKEAVFMADCLIKELDKA